MSNNNKLMILLIAGMKLTACQTINIPDAYNFTVKESRGNPYGCWTIVTFVSARDTLVQNSIAGELIYMDMDTIYVLEADHRVSPIYYGSVKNAELLTHKNQAGTYALMTSLFFVPNIIGAITNSEFGGEFLIMGIPSAAVGVSHVLIEGLRQRNILLYPKNNKLESFKIYSRFPFGKPDNIDFNQLILRKPGTHKSP